MARALCVQSYMEFQEFNHNLGCPFYFAPPPPRLSHVPPPLICKVMIKEGKIHTLDFRLPKLAIA